AFFPSTVMVSSVRSGSLNRGGSDSVASDSMGGTSDGGGVPSFRRRRLTVTLYVPDPMPLWPCGPTSEYLPSALVSAVPPLPLVEPVGRNVTAAPASGLSSSVTVPGAAVSFPSPWLQP